MAALLRPNHTSRVDFLTDGHTEVAELFAGRGQFSKAFARLGADVVAMGQFWLGSCHIRGQGVPSNLTEGRRLWQLAAAKGHELATQALARLEKVGGL